MRFNCPEYGRPVLVSEGDGRKRIECPGCREVILVPRQAGPQGSPWSRRDHSPFPVAQLLRGRVYRWYSGLARVRWGKL